MDTNTPYVIPDSPAPVPAQRPPRVPDPGSRTGALLALIFSLIFIGAVLFTQQSNVKKMSSVKPDPAAASDSSMFTVFAKGFTKCIHAVFPHPDKTESAALAPNFKQITGMAQTPDEKLRSAIVIGELADAQAAIAELENADTWVKDQIKEFEKDPKKGLEINDAVRKSFDDNRDLLLRHYRSKIAAEDATSSAPPPLSSTELASLKDHFGWFGRLAEQYGAKDSPERNALFAGGQAVVVMMVCLFCLFGLALVAGLILVVVAFILFLNGTLKLHFNRPAPGGSVYLETVAVFAFSFLLLQLVVHLLAGVFFHKGDVPPPWFIHLHFGLQWLLALVPLYPLLRGVSFSRWRADIGFTAPRGIFREIGAGILAYCAGLILFVLAALFSIFLKIVLEFVSGGDQGPPPSNPIFEEFLGTDTISLVLLVSLATIWAPFVEEAIFRGALFRHLRSRTPLLIAAAISALAFGVMHGYEFVMLGPVIALGFVFALMREWRGSLIPSITAHMLHNGTLVLSLLIILRLINS